MFCCQCYKSGECETLTAEGFAQLTVSERVNTLIKKVRKLRAEGKVQGADLSKRQLPLLCFCAAGFDVLPAPSDSKDGRRKKGQPGRWRLQEGVRLSGLFMADIDHIGDPKALFQQWVDAYVKENEGDLPADPAMQRAAFCHSLGIVLVHKTSSDEGLRLVAIADARRGNLADNQAWLASQLGYKNDDACKDASRGSFCPGFEDILYIDKEKLFNYDNPEYDKKFGPLYRGGHSEPTAVSGNGSAQPAAARQTAAPLDSVAAGGVEGGPAEDDGLAKRLEEGYHGHSYKEICDQWFITTMGGLPAAGDRHRSLLSLAADLRYITDNNAQLLERVLRLSDVGMELEAEGADRELADIAAGACKRQMWRSIPQRFRPVLEALGIQLDDKAADARPGAASAIDYEAWWRRLEPLLGESPVLREAVAPLPDHHKLAGVLAAGAMLGTYLTRCWWEHFDGNDYRLSFLVYIIGSAASGKSFVPKLDALIMAPMMAADRVGREWERQYKEDMKKRAASSKNAKSEAPEQQHPVIRYVPSTISNAMLYRRLTDAVDNEAIGPDGQPMHLHCYTCEAELATALRAQQGSWAGKLDLECKSFQNEVAGVDYANDQSVNGIIQVNWNQVVTGTPDAMGRKIRPGTVLDGLVTRLVVFPMPSSDYAMIERQRAYRDHERECLLRSAGIRLEQVKGELKADRLVDFCYQYEKQLAREAAVEQDLCLDYFRKRIPLIMMRYTLVRMVCRAHPQALPKGGGNEGLELEVTDSDLEFARLIGDFCLFSQMHMFGQQVMDALEAEKRMFVPKRRANKVRQAYKQLPREGITREMLVERGISKDTKAASQTLLNWLADKLVNSNPQQNIFTKLYDEIPL